MKLLGEIPGLPSDWELLMLAFPESPRLVESLVVAHLAVFVVELWEGRNCLRPVSRAQCAASFKAHFPRLRSLF